MGRLKQSLWQVQRMLLLGYAGASLYHIAQGLLFSPVWSVGLGVGCLVCDREEPYVGLERQADGGWQATLCGHFTLEVGEDHPFRLRLLLIFLGLLQSNQDQRKSRRTRDGRTPFVRQEQMGAWTQTKQEHISRWTGWWLKGDWANLLSLKTAEVLTGDLVERIVTVCASFPNWSAEAVYQHLHQQGLKVSQAQVEQACQQSGWKQLQDRLKLCFGLKADVLHLQDEWLVAQLLSQMQTLLMKVEAAGLLTPEERWAVNDLQTLATQAGVRIEPPFPVQPWMQAMEKLLLGTWEQVTEQAICCSYCGSSHVAPKSKKPRQKKFYDAQGQLQTVDVYRYYCHNRQCAWKSFTHLPAGLVLYSPFRTQVHLLAAQMYAWGHSNYRRTGAALGVHSMTAYRWVSAWGHDLLPVAALFGLVRSSGVVGVDEKYVLVPKNDKPAGTMRRWMYVYLAVDPWTYDLLHIAIYPYNNDDSAKAFLLALRAKGYHPHTIVTDLRQDYGPVIALVFPDAQHHECIFHALQNVQKHFQNVYGRQLAEKHPEALLLKQQIYSIFDTISPSVALSRYQQVIALKMPYLEATPDAFVIFDFLERHWPKLLNAIGSDSIPTTNNITELVIRRFDQHYQNFCGFESISSAQAYLAVFEKLYRFTPFSQDAQPRIRGKSPLQLAGYDVSLIPLSLICFGLSVDWPTESSLVPI
jgi:transposase-like protein